MNKKVALSMISATVVASMAASAFAAPQSGVYIGGSVDKFYQIHDLTNLTEAGNKKFAEEMKATAYENMVFVDFDGKGASVREMMANQEWAKIKRVVKKSDFEGVYNKANLDGTSGAAYDPRPEADGETPTGELKVESVSAINALTVDVKFGTAVDRSTAENFSSNYSITPVNGSALTIAGAKLQEDGRTVRLTLATSSAVTKIATNYTVSVKDVLNTKGDAIAEFSQVISLVDNVRPQVKATSFVDTNTFKVELSEPVDFTNINNAVTVYDGLTPVTTVAKTPNTTTKDSFTVSLAGLDSKKEYKLVINSQILDFAGNAISPNPYETTIKPVADTVDPLVDSITPVNLSNFKVKFNEKIKAQSVGQYFNIAIDDANVTPTSVTPVVDSNDTEFIVKLNAPVTKGLRKVTVKNFQDVAGNPNPITNATFTKYIDFQDTTPAFTTTTGALKTIAGTNYVVFKFANPIASKTVTAPVVAQRVADGVTFDTTIANTAFAIKNGVGGVIGLAEDELAINISSLAAGAYSLTLPAGAVTDSYGGTNLSTKVDFTVGNASAQTQVSATTEPAGSAAINGDTAGETVDQVIVVFSAEVGDSAKDVANYTVEGQRVFKSAEFYGNKNTVRLTLNDDAIKYDGNYVLGISGVKDKNNKDVKAYSKLIKFAENQKPYIAGAEVTALNGVKVTFNESISSPAALDKEDLNVYVNGTKVALTSATFTGNTATVVLTDALTSTTAKVETETSAAFDGKDANGNLGKKLHKVEAVWKIADNSGTGVAGSLGTITQGQAAVVAQAATGTITYGTPVDGNTVTVDGTTFTKAAAGSATEFSTIAELTALIDALADVNATDDGTTITVTAAATGTAGNSIDLAASAATVSGATLTGGADAVNAVTESADLTVTAGATATGNVTVTVNGTAHTVAVATGDTDAQVAGKIAAKLTADGVTGYAVSNPSGAIVRFVSTTASTNVADITVTVK